MTSMGPSTAAPVQDILSGVVRDLQHRYSTLEVTNPSVYEMPIALQVGFDLRNSRMMLDTADIIAPKIPFKNLQEGTFGTFAIVHDGSFYRLDEFYFFGGVRKDADGGEYYPRTIVRDLANMFATLIEGRASHFVPSGQAFDLNRKPAHNVFSSVYAFSYVSKKMQPFTDPGDLQVSLVDNVAGYLDFVRSTALLSRNRLS